MILDHLALQNFKNFQDKKVDFSPGMNVLQGPNGSGKTTILEGIEFALFGSVVGRVGLEPLVKLGETVASVSLTFILEDDVGKRTFTVLRQIGKGETGASSTRTYLTRDGMEVSSRKATVDHEILTILGLGHGSYGNTCYIRQGEIRALLEAGKDREREIDRMIGLGVFEDAWRDLRKSEADLERDVASAKEELIKAKAEVDTLSSVSKELSERMEEKIRIEKEIREAEEKLGDLARIDVPGGPSGDFVRLEKAKAAQAEKIQALDDQRAQLEDRIESMNDRLLEMESEILRRGNRIESLKDERSSIADRMKRINEEVERSLESRRDLEKEAFRLEADLEAQKGLITTFSQMELRGELECPICGSQLTREHARETRRSLDRKVRELQEEIEKRRANLRRFAKSEEASRSRADRLTAQVEEISREISESEAQISGVRLTKEETEGEMGSLLQQKRELESELQSQKKALEELERATTEEPPEMGIDEQLAQARASYLASKQILERLEKEIPQLMERLAEQQMRKATLKAVDEKHTNRSRELERLRDIRWALNNIGPYARQKILASVSERTADLFSRIYSGGLIKGVSLTQDYDIQAEMPSGVRLQSRLLSVGERVISGLALRIALAQVWQKPSAGEPGPKRTPDFLILDEPTEYLDESNVRALARTIAGLQAMGQVIIVTHDRDLMEEMARRSEINKIELAPPGSA